MHYKYPTQSGAPHDYEGEKVSVGDRVRSMISNQHAIIVGFDDTAVDMVSDDEGAGDESIIIHRYTFSGYWIKC